MRWRSFAVLALGLASGCGLSATGLPSGPADAASSSDVGSRPDVAGRGDSATRTDATFARDATSRDAEAGRDGSAAHAPAPGDGGDDSGHDAGMDAVPCVAECPVGAACTASSECSTDLCRDGGCAKCVANDECPTLACTDAGACGSCAPTCTAGAACTSGSDCASSYCAGHVCAIPASCNELHIASPAAPSSSYLIGPTGAGIAFEVYCDMTDQGGGWTLVAKMGTQGSPGTLDYGSAYWTTSGMTLEATSTNLSQTEAMFASYSNVPFKSILGMMAALGQAVQASNVLVIPVGDATSLEHLIETSAANAITTTLGRSTWLGLTSPTAAIQPDCNSEGINRNPTGNGADPMAGQVRIGILGNDGVGADDCTSPDSYVGFGGSYGHTYCSAVSLSAGSMAGIACSGGTANIQDFGYLFVR